MLFVIGYYIVMKNIRAEVFHYYFTGTEKSNSYATFVSFIQTVFFPPQCARIAVINKDK